MAEGEIYRKSGENERIGSISGSPIEKTLPSDNPDALDYPASEDKDIEEAAESKILDDTPDTRVRLLMQGKARFSVSEGVSASPFAERIKKLRSKVASIMESLGSTKE